MTRSTPPWLCKLALNLWPPFLGAGIYVRRISAEMRCIEVELRLGRLNRNHQGTHAGGSLFAMTDPFCALMLRHNLPPDYLVWDKAATIDFIAPGRGPVHAAFELTQGEIDAILRMTAGGEKHLHVFRIDVVDAEGLTVALVAKMIYVRRRKDAL